jgi:hypothetical protein
MIISQQFATFALVSKIASLILIYAVTRSKLFMIVLTIVGGVFVISHAVSDDYNDSQVFVETMNLITFVRVITI